MNLVYSEHPDWSLPYWLDMEIPKMEDDVMAMMDVNQWIADRCGPIGELWGYERKTITLPYPRGLNPVKVRLHYMKMTYSWRFKNKEDAMVFKLAWSGR